MSLFDSLLPRIQDFNHLWAKLFAGLAMVQVIRFVLPLINNSPRLSFPVDAEIKNSTTVWVQSVVFLIMTDPPTLLIQGFDDVRSGSGQVLLGATFR